MLPSSTSAHYLEYTTVGGTRQGNIVAARLDLRAIGRRIRQIRGADMNQTQFGTMCGIGQGQLSKYELGLSVPTLDFLLKLKAYSGRSLDWIVSGKE